MIESMPSTETQNVLEDIVLERHRQIQLWGHNEDTPDGTGPAAGWLPESMGGDRYPTALELEEELRYVYEQRARSGEPLTWRHFLLEEFAEAMCEDDPEKLYEELVQVAAVATSWCEKLRARLAL